MFGPNKKLVNNNIVVKIDGVPIEIVHHTKFLGVILDDKLT